MTKCVRSLIACVLLMATMLGLLAGCKDEPEDTTYPISDYEPTEATFPVSLPEGLVSLGFIRARVYYNEYLNLKFDLSDKWTYRTAEQMQKLPEPLDKILNAPNNTELTQIQVLKATWPTNKLSVSVDYQLFNEYDRRRFTVMTEDAIVDTMLEQKSVLEILLQQEGISEVKVSKTTVEFLGRERPAIYATGKYQGHDHYVVIVYEYKLGHYGATIQVESTGRDYTGEILSMFEVNE